MPDPVDDCHFSAGVTKIGRLEFKECISFSVALLARAAKSARIPRVFPPLFKGELILCMALAICLDAHALEARPPVKPKPESSPGAEVIDLNPAPANTIAEILEPENTPPQVNDPDAPRVAIAADGEIALNGWLLLDGSATFNPAGDALEFAWKQTAGPALTFSESELKQPRLWIFLAHTGEYRFVLRAKNAKGWSAPSERKFTVRPGRAVLPEREARRIAGAGERCVLPGEGWSQVAGPAVQLDYEEGGTVFRPGRAALYLFEAPRAGEVPERRAVIVPPGRDELLGDRRPITRIARNAMGQAGKSLVLNASLSFDPDGAEETQQLKASWRTAEKYRGVELEALPNLRARFKASRPGLYSVLLTISDGKLESDPVETVFVQINAAPNDAVAELPGFVEEELPGAPVDDVRYRKVSLGLWGDLERAVQLFPSRCGVALRVDSEFAQVEKFASIPLNLEVMDGALMHLVDWIGRQTDSRYRRERDRSFWLTTPLAWTKEEKLAAVAVLVDALYTRPDASDLMNQILPAFKPILATREGCSLEFEKSRQEIHGILPASAAARLKEIFAALRVPEVQGLPPGDLPSAAEYRLQKALAETRVSISQKNERLDFVLRELSKISGVAMAFDPRQFPAGVPRISLELREVPLRDAARRVVEAAGFDGCSAESPGGLWFFKGERPYPSSELLWDHAVVRAYDLTRLLQTIAPTAGHPLSGETISYIIQRRIYPASWKEPGALIFFHPQTRKLLVMHGPAAQRKVLDFLYDLAERGEWALGPVEEAARK